MRRSIFKSVVCAGLSAVMLVSAMPAFAASTGSSAADPSLGEDSVQGAQTEYTEVGTGASSTDVFLTVDSSNILVGVPTTIILSGTPDSNGNYTGNYSVSVSGDIAGDQQVIVEPKDYNVPLKQTGKNDKTATFSQEQTSFTSEDLSNNLVTTGSVTANGLTAGSWAAEGSFLIGSVTRYSLYSSLELAATDSNALTTDNADVTRGDLEHAVAGLYIQDDNAYIRMFQDESDIQGVTFSNDTELNLNGCTLEFADDVMTCMTFEKQYVVYDGAINKTDIGTVISDNQSYFDGNCSISNVDVNLNKTSVSTGNMVGFDLSADEVVLNDFNIVASGEGNNSNIIASGATRNENGEYSFINCDWNLSSAAEYVYGLQAKGKINFDNNIFNISTNTPNTESQLFLVRAIGSNITVDNMTANIINNSKNDNGLLCGTAFGFYLYSVDEETQQGENNLTINSVILNIDGNCIPNINDNTPGTALAIGAGNSVEINGTEETTKLKCFGNCAISAQAGANLTINGGYFASPNHGGFYSTTGSTGSLEINGGTFVNNYSEYSEDRYDYETNHYISPYGACYIGANDGTTDQVINIRNATFINMNESYLSEKLAEDHKAGSANEYGRGVNFTTNFGYSPIKEANFYDCVIKSRYTALRIDGATTTVNFYGDKTVIDGSIDQNGRIAVMGSGTYNDYTGKGLFTNQIDGLRFLDGQKVIGSLEYNWTRWHGDWRLTELTIPDGIEWINYRAFYNCSYITTLTIPDSVTKISDGAFANCGWLKTVNIPDELLIQLGNDGRIDDVFSGSPCVDTLTERYNELVA